MKTSQLHTQLEQPLENRGGTFVCNDLGGI